MLKPSLPKYLGQSQTNANAYAYAYAYSNASANANANSNSTANANANANTNALYECLFVLCTRRSLVQKPTAGTPFAGSPR